jgi:hypothetical protein
MKTLFKNTLFMLALAGIAFTSCKKDDDDNNNNGGDGTTGKLELKFDHGWGPAHLPFSLNAALTHPMTQEEITFTTLRYYLTNIQLHRPDGSVWTEEESYRIVDVAGNSIPTLTMENVPSGRYNKITFMIGVDSLRNTSGAQTGALDPAENMFWSWTTGYIFIKAEGVSPSAPQNMFVYHLGGFEGPNNAIRTRTLEFGGAHVDIASNARPSIHFKVNAARFWHGGISLNDINMIHMPGPDAVTLANNFIGAFSFDHVH